MTIYSLYVKTHKKTGLKYLGQTSQDPIIYRGSGKDWIGHISQHGNDVITDILYQSEIRKNMTEMGCHFSVLFNVVGAMDDFGNKIYANRIPETGGGGGSNRGKLAGKVFKKEPCCFCSREFAVNGALSTHEKSCRKNPNRVPAKIAGITRGKSACQHCDTHIDSQQLHIHEKYCDLNPNKVKAPAAGIIFAKTPCQHCGKEYGSLHKHEKCCEMNPNRIRYSRKRKLVDLSLN